MTTLATPQRSRFINRYALEAVPRYTSYPPATAFHDGVSAPSWQDWTRELSDDAALSIYVHIPFCRSMCWYCGCNTTVPNKDERVARYLEALHTEICQRSEELSGRGKVRHIHFGGGSPDMLSAKRFSAILDALRAHFELAGDAEIAVELDPRGLSADYCRDIAAAGVNRASLGVQDLSEEVQRLIHRIQPAATVENAVNWLRAAGIAAVNMDIMYGLPAQTVTRVADTASKAAALEPDRIAVFGYAHVPWFKKHQRAIPEDRLPGAEERFRQMETAAEILAGAGYEAVGFDHFARPGDTLAEAAKAGRLRRNFQGYTDDAYDALIGLGASAISDAPGGFAQNIPDPARYADAILAGRTALARGVARSAEDRRIGAQIERLMCDFEVEFDPSGPVPEDALLELERDGLVRSDAGRLHVTPAGRPYVRNIAARLDPAFSAMQSRHSRAV